MNKTYGMILIILAAPFFTVAQTSKPNKNPFKQLLADKKVAYDENITKLLNIEQEIEQKQKNAGYKLLASLIAIPVTVLAASFLQDTTKNSTINATAAIAGTTAIIAETIAALIHLRDNRIYHSQIQKSEKKRIKLARRHTKHTEELYKFEYLTQINPDAKNHL